MQFYKKLLTPLSIALLYLFAGVLWIAFSDGLVASIATDMEQLELMQRYKGWFYVLITSIPLYFLIRKHQDYVTESNQLLVATEKRYEYLFLNNPYPIVACDSSNGQFLFQNKAMLVTFGYSMREFSKMNIYDLFTPKHANKLEQKLKDDVKNNRLGIFTGIKKNKSELKLDISVYEIILNKQKVWLLLLNDVTSEVFNREQIRKFTEGLEKKIEERTLELRNVNDELEAFSYSVSHDLRAPLRAIDGFSQIILDQDSKNLSESGKKYFERIRKATQKMAELIDELLQLSRVTKSTMNTKTVNLSDIASKYAEDFAKEYTNKEYEVIIEPDLTVYADEGQMNILMYNLISNAFKYSSNKGNPKIEIGSQDINGVKRYFIKDNGAGFDTAYADKLFKPFQRLHEDAEFPGIGVGLATVYRIVKRHNGIIFADSEVGSGTTFYFELNAIESAGN